MIKTRSLLPPLSVIPALGPLMVTALAMLMGLFSAIVLPARLATKLMVPPGAISAMALRKDPAPAS